MPYLIGTQLPGRTRCWRWRILPETSQLRQLGPGSPLRRPCPHLGVRCFGGQGGPERGADTLQQPRPVPCRDGGSAGTGPAGTASPSRGGRTARGRRSAARPRAGRPAPPHLRGAPARLARHSGRRQGGELGGLLASLRAPPAGSQTPAARAPAPPALLPSLLHTAPWGPGPPTLRFRARCSRPFRRRRPGPGGSGGGCCHHHGAVRRGGAAEGQYARPGERRGRALRAGSPAAGRARAAGRAGEEPRPRSRLRAGPRGAAFPRAEPRPPRSAACAPQAASQRSGLLAGGLYVPGQSRRAGGVRGEAPRPRQACLRGRRGPAQGQGQGQSLGQSLAPSRPSARGSAGRAGVPGRRGQTFLMVEKYLGGLDVCFLNARCCHQYGNFIDDLRLYVRGGTGGMGYPRLGGEGGRGGDVWFVAQERTTLKTIRDRYPQKRFLAGTGANSSVRALKGEKGKDCEVHVPVGISVLCDDGKQIGELNAAGERLLAARGGLGGSLATNFLPCKGQRRIVRLDLKLIADVGLVGFPNAGKSSLLSKISHAKPEIANYVFTTVQPELGKVMYADYKQISVADLPGLIEGAHANKGMGHKFLKHVERTKQLLLVVDISGFQLSIKTRFRTAFETILLLTKELELYKEELLTKPALLAINKMDLPCAKDNLSELMKQLQNPQDFLHLLQEEVIPANTLEFKDIIPISTYTGEGIEELKACIRKSIDEEAEQENEEYRKKKLLLLQTSEEGQVNRS